MQTGTTNIQYREEDKDQGCHHRGNKGRAARKVKRVKRAERKKNRRTGKANHLIRQEHY